MRFYTNQHQYYCGIDLHAKMMYVCIVDKEGQIRLHRNIPTNPETFLSVIAPFREDMVVGVECMFCWYWVADLCADNGIPFVLGHALYMKAVHGGKTQNDKIDSEKIARLLKGGMFPLAYVYPREMRATRDLMRRRLFFVTRRAELLSHVQMTYQQYNMPVPVNTHLIYRKHRDALQKPFKDSSVVRMVEADLEMIEHYSLLIRSLEAHIYSLARKKGENAFQLALLKSVPGIGPVLSATILYEIHDIKRFATVQDFIL